MQFQGEQLFHFYLPPEWESTLKGKNLLPEEQILSLKSRLNFCKGLKELFIRLTVRVFRGRWSNFVCVLLSLMVLNAGCGK